MRTTFRQARRARPSRCWSALETPGLIWALCANRFIARTASPGVRRVLGVLALARKYGPAAADETAQTAPERGLPTYRFLRRYLERRTPAPLTLKQVDPLIRQLGILP